MNALPDVTAVIQVYYPERISNLIPIIANIRLAGIERIIVWNNNPSQYELPGLFIKTWALEQIQSSFDTLIGQYAACFLTTTPYVYCQNDDLVVYDETIVRMRHASQPYKDRFVALSGVNLNRMSDKPYSESKPVACGFADVMQGRAWMAHKKALVDGFSRILDRNVDPGLGEDLFFSIWRTFVLPDAHYTDIEEGATGLSRLPGHTEARDEWVRKLLGVK